MSAPARVHTRSGPEAVASRPRGDFTCALYAPMASWDLNGFNSLLCFKQTKTPRLH